VFRRFHISNIQDPRVIAGRVGRLAACTISAKEDGRVGFASPTSWYASRTRVFHERGKVFQTRGIFSGHKSEESVADPLLNANVRENIERDYRFAQVRGTYNTEWEILMEMARAMEERIDLNG
jgi:hypothetical protein